MTQKEIEKAIEVLKSFFTEDCDFDNLSSSVEMGISALETVAKIPKVILALERLVEMNPEKSTKSQCKNDIISNAKNFAYRNSLELIKGKLCGGMKE